MPEPQQDIQLQGCTPEPLMAYLKALGILRLVSEQKDPDARGWWCNDVLWLRARVLFTKAVTNDDTRDSLTDFFLNHYQPTPIVAPWAGGCGFFKKDNKKAVQALRDSKAPRTKAFASVIHAVDSILKTVKVGDKPVDDDKAALIRRYRQELPDPMIRWMDAVMVLQDDGQAFAPLLGTGGNDGRLDFTQNFMQRIVALGLHKTVEAPSQSRDWLRHALFAEPSRLTSLSVGQFAPGRSGGPNATQGMEGLPTDNPWDFILMLEGALLLAGAVVRRFGIRESGRAAFPFTVRAIAAGFDSPAPKDQADSRGELWLPVWDRPATAAGLRQLFSEGRADIQGRPAEDGTDFARAAANLGVDRGISEFMRVAFLKRSGKAYLATPLGRFAVAARREADLLRELDRGAWLDGLRKACAAKDAPPRFGRVLRAIDSAIFDFCKYGGSAFFQRILIALGRAERELAGAERFREKYALRPIARLSFEWLNAANDGSPEFALALGLATVYDPEARVGPLRSNLEPIDWTKRCRAWAERDRAVVWNAADLATNLGNVLDRRVMDGRRNECGRLPIEAPFDVPLDIVAGLIEGQLDEERIESLIWCLTLVDSRPRSGHESVKAVRPTDPPLLPRDYALLKLLFLPRPLVPERVGSHTRWRLANLGEPGLTIRPEARILPLLRAGRSREACVIAAHRLRASGLPPMPGPLSTGVTRDHVWAQTQTGLRRAQRVAGALLVPISSHSVNRLVELVCPGSDAAVEAFVAEAQGEHS